MTVSAMPFVPNKDDEADDDDATAEGGAEEGHSD